MIAGTSAYQPQPTRAAQRVRRRLPDETGVFVALVTLVVVGGALRPKSSCLRPCSSSWRAPPSSACSPWAWCSLVVIRDIDLSIGWMFNFSRRHRRQGDGHRRRSAGSPPGIGVAFGACSASSTACSPSGLRIPVIIITLGTLSVYRGLSLVVNESTRGRAAGQERLPYFELLTLKLFGVIPMVAVVFVMLAVVLHLLLHHTRFGYRVQAMGSNPDAARLAGIPVDRTRIDVLVLMGAIAGSAGAMFLGFREAIDPITGGDYLLPVVAAVIIGGTPLSGGAGHHLRRRAGRPDHPGHQQRDPVPRHRRQVEHVRHRAP